MSYSNQVFYYKGIPHLPYYDPVYGTIYRPIENVITNSVLEPKIESQVITKPIEPKIESQVVTKPIEPRKIQIIYFGSSIVKLITDEFGINRVLDDVYITSFALL
jgi:hypothetical protein